jgi:hypothetical protein
MGEHFGSVFQKFFLTTTSAKKGLRNGLVHYFGRRSPAVLGGYKTAKKKALRGLFVKG